MKTMVKGLVVTSLVTAGLLTGVTTTSTLASAATIKTPYTALKTKSATVTTNGKYALYTKPGTVKGAKLVVSKAKMKTFGTFTKTDVANVNSNSAAKYRGSAYYLYAYGYKVTNTGSVYYRVVTMNGKYRGYVYGGKAIGKFAGGIKQTATTTKATVPTSLSGTVGIEMAGVMWNVAPYTKYPTKQLGKMTAMNSTTIPHLAQFKITGAVTRNREQDVYYHLVSTDNYQLNGWVSRNSVATYDDVLANWGVTTNN
ncbi:hypothetical protein [Lactiplantibacillus daowaiensis]|uniref:S-layer protein n=1 Tax=Lactiplantibacillus daowaiensis TaxID=2559918 RepID=A0ABW1S058_9LACO|nr:hypothetical protein [Lactiplantibacillus daowaiensis]